jgi:hypothetical protein
MNVPDLSVCIPTFNRKDDVSVLFDNYPPALRQLCAPSATVRMPLLLDSLLKVAAGILILRIDLQG